MIFLINRTGNLAKSFSLIGLVLFLVALTGCATTAENPQDPWENWNRGTQKFNDDVDEHLLKPAAEGYAYITPNFVDQGVSNFFSNLKDIRVTINDLLQLKFKQGSMDAGLFLVNTTVGLVGLID